MVHYAQYFIRVRWLKPSYFMTHIPCPHLRIHFMTHKTKDKTETPKSCLGATWYTNSTAVSSSAHLQHACCQKLYNQDLALELKDTKLTRRGCWCD